ncbi:MAG TPA: hypothetical protein VG734_18485 [Lacunisphaera sp.]|nr:hypothetical protein [Lacunisphaera sp.]
MRGNFSPLAEAARLHAARTAARGTGASPSAPARVAAAEPRWCEWPRRPASNPPFTSIRQALLAIQARHA